jgi:hypothetical protein
MSASDLKKELIALQKAFLGGPMKAMKKHELDHRLAVFKRAMELKMETPEEEPAKAGPPKAREVKTEIVSLDGETEITKPIAPVGGKVHSARYTKKPKAPDTAAPAPEAAPAPVAKVVKKKITPPKVILSEEVPVKVVKKRVPKPAAEKPAPAAAPEPVAAPAAQLVKIEKLPGGVKRMVTDSIVLA